ncbi:IS3 family transposase [Anoxybacillus sp. P3H1B]|uniref:IS3 family transposase n=1 Tax=Anoxybacillus sp. P3H1B TaxID=1769293 RepID=UPI0035112442
MTGSMSRKGNCYDNACMESFHSVLKKELVYLNKFKTRKEAREKIFEYITCFYIWNKNPFLYRVFHSKPIRTYVLFDCVILSILCV